MVPQERAAIHGPATRPLECAAYAKQPEGRITFLCHEMLNRLGQWLRVAGYDVPMLPDGTSDRELIQRAGRNTACWPPVAAKWRPRRIVDDARLHRYGRLCEAARHGSRLRAWGSAVFASRCVRIFSITTGSSTRAMIRTAPPHDGQVSMSRMNTRFRRCAQNLAATGSKMLRKRPWRIESDRCRIGSCAVNSERQKKTHLRHP